MVGGERRKADLIRNVLIHSDLNSTAIYARLNLNAVRQALARTPTKMKEVTAPQRTTTVTLKAKKRFDQQAIQPPTCWTPLVVSQAVIFSR